GQLPLALLAITLGGVTARQIIAVDVALAAFLVMAAIVGLLSSVLMRRSGSACAWVLLLLMLLLFGVHYGEDALATLVSLKYLSMNSSVVMAAERTLQGLREVSIVTRLQEVLETGFAGDVVGRQAWLHTAAGGAAFLLSWLAFNRFTRYADVAVPARGWLPRRRTRWKLLVGRPWKWALAWKDYHFITGGHALALLKLIAYSLALLLLFRWEEPIQRITRQSFPEFSRNTMLVIIAGESCLYAARIFHEELKWGTLPSIAVLPQSVVRIAYGKVAGCLLGLAPAAIVLLGLITLVPAPTARHLTVSEPGWWMLAMHLVVLLHLTALYSLIVKWGALAIAVGSLLILDALLSLPFSLLLSGLSASYGNDTAAIGPIIYFGCAASAALQVAIALRVRYAAAR
ncbi:MAG: hypothetical protein AB7Q45_25215, partial [Planctomycetaceae bacterium]